mgnify:FL=1
MKIGKIVSGSKLLNWAMKYNDLLLVAAICTIIVGVWSII